MAGSKPGRMPVAITKERQASGRVRAAIWMDEELKQALMDRAYKEGRTMAEVAADAIAAYLERAKEGE